MRALKRGALVVAALACMGYLCGCADDGSGYGFGSWIAEELGDCKGAAWLDHYAETGDMGVEVVPRH
jgi:hypothetical protein